MSKIQFNQEFIVHHAQNNSPSKYMFSFSKSPRFFKLKRDTQVDKFYNLPSTLAKRSTAMGFGKKLNFSSKNSGSEFISIKRYFDKNYQPGLKFSFGISREKYSKVYYPGLQLIDLSIPGPGKYNVVGRPGINSPKYTMRPKCLKKVNKDRALSPGPGEYSSVVKINSEGKCPLSKIANVRTINFGNNKARRFFYKINNVPGPGAYKLKSLLGINFISKYNSGKLISIHKKILAKKKLDDTPGPGTYSSFSEFGIPSWENDKTIKSNRNKMKLIRKKILSAEGGDEKNKSKTIINKN